MIRSPRCFNVYVETQLAPTLRPGDVVILDNVPVHKSAKAEAALRARGAAALAGCSTLRRDRAPEIASTIRCRRMPPSPPPTGQAGLQDRVDRHWGELFRAAAISTLLGIGIELAVGDDEDRLVNALRRSGQSAIDDAGWAPGRKDG